MILCAGSNTAIVNSKNKILQAYIECYDDGYYNIRLVYKKDREIHTGLLAIYCKKDNNDLMIIINDGTSSHLSRPKFPKFVMFVINHDTGKIEDRLDVEAQTPASQEYLTIKDVKFSSNCTRPDRSEKPDQIMILSVQDGLRIRKIAVFLDTKIKEDGNRKLDPSGEVIAGLEFMGAIFESKSCIIPVAFELKDGGSKEIKLEGGSFINLTYTSDEVTQVKYTRKRSMLPGYHALRIIDNIKYNEWKGKA